MEVLPRRPLLGCDSAFCPPSNRQPHTSSIDRPKKLTRIFQRQWPVDIWITKPPRHNRELSSHAINVQRHRATTSATAPTASLTPTKSQHIIITTTHIQFTQVNKKIFIINVRHCIVKDKSCLSVASTKTVYELIYECAYNYLVYCTITKCQSQTSRLQRDFYLLSSTVQLQI